MTKPITLPSLDDPMLMCVYAPTVLECLSLLTFRSGDVGVC
ncbi:MAG: hypothetical protein QXX19_05855 [Candidatus Caldarchaeum sp.]